MSQQSPATIVTAFIDAIEARDFERAREFLSDTQFTYRSSISKTDNADTCMALISRIGPILERVERHRTFVDGGDVCSILHFRTTMENLKDVAVVQLATVADEKIIALEVFFDASEYNKMISGEQ